MLRAIVVSVAVAGFLLVAAPKAQAQARYPYYHENKWYSKGSGKSKYYYTHYYYGDKKYHHAYYYPSKSKRYVYYYNYQKKRYWGRYDLETGKYSLLPDGKRKENLDDIAEDDFPKPVDLEKIAVPGSDNLKMTKPPDLPD